jgi:hypothetical protein
MPATAKTKSAAIRAIICHITIGGFLSRYIAKISSPMATAHNTRAIMRNFIALPFASAVGVKDLVPPEDEPPETRVIFFDVPLPDILIPPILYLYRVNVA